MKFKFLDGISPRLKQFIWAILAFALGNGTGHFVPEALQEENATTASLYSESNGDGQETQDIELKIIEAETDEPAPEDGTTPAPPAKYYDTWCNCKTVTVKTIDIGGGGKPTYSFDVEDKSSHVERKVIKTTLPIYKITPKFLKKIGFCEEGSAGTIVKIEVAIKKAAK